MANKEAWAGEVDLLADAGEKRLIYSVLDSFRQYRRAAHLNVTHHRRQAFYALPPAHQEYLRGPPISLLDTFNAVDDAIDANANLAEAIMEHAASSLGLSYSPDSDPPWAGTASNVDMSKCRSTINQLYRDWSVEGAVERSTCISVVYQALQGLKADWEDPNDAKVLVPGAGLGRLVFELCAAGHQVQGNEFSYHQLFASSFLLNQAQQVNEWPLYPFMGNFSNNITRKDQLKKVLIPDACPSTWLDHPDAKGTMSMTTGDFVVVYQGAQYRGAFDAVATVFFIDTAPNFIRYVETVGHCLRPGGIWVNVGPLLWHQRESPAGDSAGDPAGDQGPEHTGVAEPGSFELSFDETLAVIRDHGFDIIEEAAYCGKSGYIGNPRSMLQYEYRLAKFVAKRR